MSFFQQIQKLFNDYPVVSGIVLFLIITLFVILIWAIIVLILMKNRNKKKKLIALQQGVGINGGNKTSSSRSSSTIKNLVEEEELDPTFKNYVLKRNEIGNLVIENLIDSSEVYEEITREVIENIFLSENSKLFLPEGNIEIYSNQAVNQFGLSAPIEKNSRNEAIFEQFIDYIEYHLAPWSKSKFRV